MPRQFTEAEAQALLEAGRSVDDIIVMAGQPSFLSQAQAGPRTLPTGTDVFQGEEMPGEEPYSVWGAADKAKAFTGPRPWQASNLLQPAQPILNEILGAMSGGQWQLPDTGETSRQEAGMTIAPFLVPGGEAAEATAATGEAVMAGAKAIPRLLRMMGRAIPSGVQKWAAPIKPEVTALTRYVGEPLPGYVLGAAENAGPLSTAHFPQVWPMAQRALGPATQHPSPIPLLGDQIGTAARAGANGPGQALLDLIYQLRTNNLPLEPGAAPTAMAQRRFPQLFR
jgi:hypothetical protein